MAKRKRQERSLREALETAIIADPDDLSAHMAYADFLMEQDDPRDQARGDFIRVQLALEDESRTAEERRPLRMQEKKLLAAHQREWLGDLAPYLLDNEQLGYASLYGFDHVGDFAFRRGWLDYLRICYLSIPLARALRDAPQTQLVSELIIEAIGDGYPESVSPDPSDGIPEREHSIALCPLVQSRYLGNVRRLRIGLDHGDDYQNYSCHAHSTIIPLLVYKMPRLEELALFANRFWLEDIFRVTTLENLRVLQIYHYDAVHKLHLLAANKAFRNLTHLLLHPHHLAWWRNQAADEAEGYREAQGYIPLSVVTPLLRSKNLPHLTHLRLRVSSMGDKGCEEIVRSGIVKRLKMLDLRHGRITDRGAETLASCPDIRKLEWLDLDRNSLSTEGIARIRGLGIPVRVDDQHEPLGPDEVVDDAAVEGYATEELYPYLCEGEFE